jgi:hypothetical protein
MKCENLRDVCDWVDVLANEFKFFRGDPDSAFLSEMPWVMNGALKGDKIKFTTSS